MVHKEGGGPASKCKTEKNAIKYGLTDAIHQGQNQKWLRHPCVLGGRLFGEGGPKQARMGNGKKRCPARWVR